MCTLLFQSAFAFAVENCIAMKCRPSSNRRGVKVYYSNGNKEKRKIKESRKLNDFASFNNEMMRGRKRKKKDKTRKLLFSYSTCLLIHKITVNISDRKGMN